MPIRNAALVNDIHEAGFAEDYTEIPKPEIKDNSVGGGGLFVVCLCCCYCCLFLYLFSLNDLVYRNTVLQESKSWYRSRFVEGRSFELG